MSREMQKRMSIIIGSFLVIVMGATAILPAISRPNITPTEAATPLPPPEPFPPPIANSELDFSARYLHPGALYTVPIPQPFAWNQILPGAESQLARTTMRGDLHVIEVYISNEPELTTDALPEHFSSGRLESTWRNYQQVSRRGPGELRDDRFYVDYNLSLNRRLFNARHLAWTDGQLLHVVRVVGPGNATEQTIYLAEQMAAGLAAIPQFSGGQAGWSAYWDREAAYVIRFPARWELLDSAPGRPASLAIGSDASLRLESIAGALPDESAARKQLADARPNAELLTSAAWQDGLALSYTYETALGEEQSGVWVIRPGADGAILRAEVNITGIALDLLDYGHGDAATVADEVSPEVAQYREIFAALRTLTPVSWDYISQDELTTDENGVIVLPAGD